jgi:hypothetical protein
LRQECNRNQVEAADRIRCADIKKQQRFGIIDFYSPSHECFGKIPTIVQTVGFACCARLGQTVGCTKKKREDGLFDARIVDHNPAALYLSAQGFFWPATNLLGGFRE